MSDLLHEQLSAFMDGELPSEECELLIKRIAADGDLAESWHAYHVISDALRDQLAPGAAQDLAPRVDRALDSERRRYRSPRRLATIAAGVAVIGLAGLAGALVSRQIGGGQVFAPGGVGAPAGTGQVQVDWRRAPIPVRSELNRYLLMHDPYGAAPEGLASEHSANAATSVPGRSVSSGGGSGVRPR